MSNNIIVSTGDIKLDYEIIGPVYFSVSNKGLFGSQLGNLIKKYKGEIEELKEFFDEPNKSGLGSSLG